MTGVTINGKHCETDLGMIMTGATIEQPAPRTHYVSVPGRSMPIDATEATYGGVTYDSRTISLTFAVRHDFGQFFQYYSRLANLWHGKAVKVSFDADPNSYYMGRASVSATKSAKGLDEVAVTITAQPFKYYIVKPSDPAGEYLWDDINFETDMFENLNNVSVAANVTKSISITAGDVPLTPTVTTTTAMTVTLKGKTYSITANEPKELPVVLYKETVTLTASSPTAGKISITYRGESL